MLKRSGHMDVFFNHKILYEMRLKTIRFYSTSRNSTVNNFPVYLYTDLSKEERLTTLSESLKDLGSAPELIIDRFRKERGHYVPF